ncbi:V-type ATP synthase subunit E family protein [Anaerovorax odorimutans]|uniref:V-type ATP synthase subunit E family protein n=1 Tax=Anaerovorax odorimutans TaxID=109327 RepID=A0ABT1RNP5_9FIRM|nr:V-type ATP synthase subunit E family protein [Anaerovorax odorimutans]MCQ4636809.1 V-type ATP synthase subunit E family protein [Anaerovorax odorimutans]
MDNISKILEAIRAEGQEEADKIAEAGQKNVDEIARLYSEEAGIEKDAILKKAKKEAEEITQRGISQAGIESRNTKLTARRAALEKTFEMAADKLAQLPEEKKLKIYKGLIGTYSGSKQVTVVLNEADQKAFGKKLASEAGQAHGMEVNLAQQPGDFIGGLIIQEGEIETNCTFEVLINDRKKETESQVAAMLFA